MRRPGPLQELPLDHFVPLNPNLPSQTSPFKSSRSNKRPLSPGGPSLFSPAKRRILNEEGIFSPEKVFKSPLSASHGTTSSPAYFADLLRGPGSPARKLDFGLPKNHLEGSMAPHVPSSSMSMDVTPTRPTTTRLAPSPEFIPKHSSAQSTSSSTSYHDDEEMEDYFSSQPRPSSSRPTVIPTMVPRELPTPPDPQSIHYPGFSVHQDTHIILPSAGSSVSTAEGPAAAEEKDGQKENVPLRRKAKKATTAPSSSSLKTLLFSPEVKKREMERIGKAKSTPATPKRIGKERQGTLTPTPHRPSTELTRVALSTPMLKETERKERRRMLEDEVDQAGDEEDEDTTDEL